MERPTEQELRAYAEMKAETIVIRTWSGKEYKSNSSDDRRDTTLEEKKIIESVIFGGLLAIRSGADKSSVKHACEYIGNILMEGKITEGRMNGYDSIYNPIGEYPEMK
jgi:hypothetical protein